MKRTGYWFGLLVFSLVFASGAWAHFGMVIPDKTMVKGSQDRNISLQASFSHPFEQIGMELVEPEKLYVVTPQGKTDLKKQLKKSTFWGHTAWETVYAAKRPGAQVFVMEPQPYWEPAEDCYIVHLTKVVVAAFGDDEGWDQELGLGAEIVPLAKPHALYAGNVFQGVVKMNGKPVPNAEVEVEYYNQDGKVHAPGDLMVTQTIKADENGVFTYAAPKAGWWGFAALNTADYQLDLNGQKKDVELGGVIWVRFYDF